MRKFADPKKPGGLCFTYNLIDKRKIFVLPEKSVGVETPTYGDFGLSSNRKVSKRKFFVLTEKAAGVEPQPTVISGLFRDWKVLTLFCTS